MKYRILTALVVLCIGVGDVFAEHIVKDGKVYYKSIVPGGYELQLDDNCDCVNDNAWTNAGGAIYGCLVLLPSQCQELKAQAVACTGGDCSNTPTSTNDGFEIQIDYSSYGSLYELSETDVTHIVIHRPFGYVFDNNARTIEEQPNVVFTATSTNKETTVIIGQNNVEECSVPANSTSQYCEEAIIGWEAYGTTGEYINQTIGDTRVDAHQILFTFPDAITTTPYVITFSIPTSKDTTEDITYSIEITDAPMIASNPSANLPVEFGTPGPYNLNTALKFILPNGMKLERPLYLVGVRSKISGEPTDITNLIQRLANGITLLAATIAVLVIVVNGAQMSFGMGVTEPYLSNIIKACIGLIIIIFAYIIVKTVLSFVYTGERLAEDRIGNAGNSIQLGVGSQ